MNKDQFLNTGLLEQYVLGLTDEEETKKVETYAETYPEIKQEIEAMRKALDQYAQEYAIMPPEELKDRVKEEVVEQNGQYRADRAEAPRSNSSFSSLSIWASLLLMIALSVFTYLIYKDNQDLQSRNSNLQLRYDQLQTDCAAEKERMQQAARAYALINHPATMPVTIEMLETPNSGRTIAYLNAPEQQALVSTRLLPNPPDGKTYQIWADVEGEMINMGTLDHNKGELQAVSFVENAESLNITIEPAGGSEEPTVELLIASGKV